MAQFGGDGRSVPEPRLHSPLPSHSGGRPSQRIDRQMVAKQENVAKGIHREPTERGAEILGLWRPWATALRQNPPHP